MTTTTERAARRSSGETLAGEAIAPVKLVPVAAKTRVSLPAAVLRDLFGAPRVSVDQITHVSLKSGYIQSHHDSLICDYEA